MVKKIKPNIRTGYIKIFPHCDPKVLHAPGECEVCDHHPEWQQLRHAWGIAFTGYEPEDKELPDPATHVRGFDNANAWRGNKAVRYRCSYVRDVDTLGAQELWQCSLRRSRRGPCSAYH